MKKMENKPTFKSVSSPHLDGEFMQCLGCKAVMDPEMCDAHICAAPEPSEYEVEMGKLRPIIADESLPAKDRLEAFQKYDRLVTDLFAERMVRIEQRFHPEILRKMVYKEFEAQLAYARKQIEKEYDLNDERRKAGANFKERREKFNKARIEMMTRQEKRLMQEMQTFVVKPIKEWFSQVDYAVAKKRGMSWIIRINFGNVYTIPQSKYGKGNQHGIESAGEVYGEAYGSGY